MRPIIAENKDYGSLIPIANNKRKAQTKTKPFPSIPIIKRTRRLDITKENMANRIPRTDKMQKIVIPK